MRPIVPRFARLRAGLAAAFAFAGLLVACESKLPTRAEIDQVDAATESREAAKSSQADTTIARPVDGAKVPTADSSTRAVDDVRVRKAAVVLRDAAAPPRKPKRVDVKILAAQAIELDASHVLWIDSDMRMAAPPADKVDTVPGLATLIGRNQEPFAPIIYIDGARATVSEMKALDRERIESVEVLKGRYAEWYYGDPEAAKGVITITTKRDGGTN